MANKIKSYFLVSGWDFPAGSLPLGTILDTPTSLQSTLYKPSFSSIDTPTYPTDKYNFATTISHSSNKHIGLFAKFLEIFGLGAEASVKYDKAQAETYSFDHVHTVWFSPSQSYISQVVKEKEVANYLKQTDYEEAIYIITGIKTVQGASVTTSHSKNRNLKAAVGFDGLPLGVPVSVGPDAGLEVGKASEATFKNSSCVVWAYQLKKVKVQRGGEVESKDFVKGALFGDGDERVLELQAGEIPEEDLNASRAYDEGDEEECFCVLPEGVEVTS
jgi:hypothetical protein